MDEGTIKTQNPKCRLYWCFIERYSHSCWYFRPLLWTVAPLPFLWPPPPLPSSQSLYRRGGGGGLSCVVDHILQEFNTTRTYKIATRPQTKTPVKTTIRDWCPYSSFVHVFTFPMSKDLHISAPEPAAVSSIASILYSRGIYFREANISPNRRTFILNWYYIPERIKQ
jgi:hypothetical protein